jgi:hypothetical protein
LLFFFYLAFPRYSQRFLQRFFARFRNYSGAETGNAGTVKPSRPPEGLKMGSMTGKMEAVVRENGLGGRLKRRPLAPDNGSPTDYVHFLKELDDWEEVLYKLFLECCCDLKKDKTKKLLTKEETQANMAKVREELFGDRSSQDLKNS